MKENDEEFRKAAMSWAGINNRILRSEETNSFWKDINPPSIVTLLHIAIQILLTQIFSILLILLCKIYHQLIVFNHFI
jgi:hypothetical protein